jgi:hypothetical protein
MSVVRNRVVVAVVVVLVLGGAAARAQSPDEQHRYGLRIDVPSGWHVRIARGVVEASTAPLPPEGRWVAGRLSRSLRPRDIDFVLFEDAPTPGQPFSRSIYRPGYPRPILQSEFGPPPFGGSNPGSHRFARRNFTVNGRFFDLFVEGGSRAATTAAVASLNILVASLQVSRGDFYPGHVPGAVFNPAPGWQSVGGHSVALAPETSTTTIASTVPYADALNDFPPQRTLKTLPQNGVIVFVQLIASNRDPPLVKGYAGSAVRVTGCGGFEGVPPTISVCHLAGLRNGQYVLDGYIVYGRAHPRPAMAARANAELQRLVLPNWPRWN